MSKLDGQYSLQLGSCSARARLALPQDGALASCPLRSLWFGSVLSFGMLGALSRRPCEPYVRSDGTSLGEGAAAVVVSSSRPRETTARPLGYAIGVGQSTDAYHPARPDPTAGAQLHAVERAFAAASYDGCPTFISGHGTGTRANDRLETKLAQLIADRYAPAGTPPPPTMASKGLYGHTFGAASLMECAEALLCARADLSLIEFATIGDQHQREYEEPWVVLKNVFAMGGLNTSVLFASEPADLRRSSTSPAVHAEVIPTGDATWTVQSNQSPQQRVAVDWAALEAVATSECRARRSRWESYDALTRTAVGLVGALLSHGGADALVDRSEVGLFIATRCGPAHQWRRMTEALDEGRPLPKNIVTRLSLHVLASDTAEFFGLQGPAAVFYTDDARDVMDAAQAAIQAGCVPAVAVVNVDHIPGSAKERGHGSFLVADTLANRAGPSLRKGSSGARAAGTVHGELGVR